MRRSIERNLRRFLDSPRASDLREKLLRRTNTERLITDLNTEFSRRLSEMAHEEDMDTGPFVLGLLNDTIQAQEQEAEKIERWQRLSGREQEVAALACQGMTNPQIAEILHISEETVKKHISSVLRKFHVKGRGILRWMLDGWDFDHPEAPWEG
jgi:DNA-binding CsgD family transcriptional regulator